jgi:beta-lactamase regulating signal transducer with metallopeptidase domain
MKRIFEWVIGAAISTLVVNVVNHLFRRYVVDRYEQEKENEKIVHSTAKNITTEG